MYIVYVYLSTFHIYQDTVTWLVNSLHIINSLAMGAESLVPDGSMLPKTSYVCLDFYCRGTIFFLLSLQVMQVASSRFTCMVCLPTCRHGSL